MKKRKDVNANEVVVSGVTFSPDMRVLIKYPASKRGKSYSIPESVEEIAEGAFADCKSLRKMKLPNTFKYDPGFLKRCSKLSDIQNADGSLDKKIFNE